MDSDKFMYMTTSKSISEALKKRVNGFVRTEFSIDADCLIVDISFKEFKFRKLISKFSTYVYEGGIDDLVTILVGAYKQQLNHAFFKEENNGRERSYAGYCYTGEY